MPSPAEAASQPLRARDLGVPFSGTPGPLNAVTDVPGVRVGHTTLIRGEGEAAVRTGVTVLRPTPDGRGVFAATFALNGNGELTSAHPVNEWGLLLSPVLLTNTLGVGTVHQAVVRSGSAVSGSKVGTCRSDPRRLQAEAANAGES